MQMQMRDRTEDVRGAHIGGGACVTITPIPLDALICRTLKYFILISEGTGYV